MAALTREGPNQFRVHFRELLRARKDAIVDVDPYLIGRALAEVMRACTMRSASGHRLSWNDYRVVLSRADSEALGPLHGALESDLEQALARDVEELSAELVGELRVSVVADEGDDLAAGDAVVRAAFVPTDRSARAPKAGMTVRGDAMAIARAKAALPRRTHEAQFVLEWAGGRTTLPVGVTAILGRPHSNAPADFVALEGASDRINKEHLRLSTSSSKIRIGRPSSANPVHVGGEPIAAGDEIEVEPPIQISLSKGDLVIVVSRA